MPAAPRRGTKKACDPCSVRKVRCDGNSPCGRCTAASWDCTYLKRHGKSGPKGPRRTTEAAIKQLQERSKLDIDARSLSDSDASFDHSSSSTVDFLLPDILTPVNGLEVHGWGWPDVIGPTWDRVRTAPQKISITCISHYFEIYQARGYAIWPVVDTEALLAHLLTHPEDMEAYGLATALCSATISQFPIDCELGNPVEDHFRVSSGLFEAEAKRARELSDHMESSTIWSLLSTFFLHAYSAHVGRMTTSTILLGEAITKAHIIGLHQQSHYQGMTAEETQHHLRIYWLLFITERAHSIQHNVPITLKRATDLPALNNLNDGSITPAFIQLCHLFRILDETLTARSSIACDALALAQRKLSDENSYRGLLNELQRADISMTRQWMRVFLWQHALGVTSLRHTNEDDEFSFSFPAKVARNVLSELATFSRSSLEAHGPGMESKLFDIANSLADVMIYVPALSRRSAFGFGPKDLIHSLSTFLAKFRGGNPAVINVLQDKLTQLGLSLGSPQKLIALISAEEERDETDTAVNIIQ